MKHYYDKIGQNFEQMYNVREFDLSVCGRYYLYKNKDDTQYTYIGKTYKVNDAYIFTVFYDSEDQPIYLLYNFHSFRDEYYVLDITSDVASYYLVFLGIIGIIFEESDIKTDLEWLDEGSDPMGYLSDSTGTKPLKSIEFVLYDKQAYQTVPFDFYLIDTDDINEVYYNLWSTRTGSYPNVISLEGFITQ